MSQFADLEALRPATVRWGQTPPDYHVRTKPIEFIGIHCTATPEGSPRTWSSIEGYHMRNDPRGSAYGRGWWCGGYHLLAHLDGSVTRGLPDEWIGWNGVHNSRSIGVCYVGGMDAAYQRPKDTRTKAQRHSLFRVVSWLVRKYGIPHENIIGHNEVANKACPCFPWDYERGIATGLARDDYIRWLDEDGAPNVPAHPVNGIHAQRDAVGDEDDGLVGDGLAALRTPPEDRPRSDADALNGLMAKWFAQRDPVAREELRSRFPALAARLGFKED